MPPTSSVQERWSVHQVTAIASQSTTKRLCWQSPDWKIGKVLKSDEAPSYAREKEISTGYRYPLSYFGCFRR